MKENNLLNIIKHKQTPEHLTKVVDAVQNIMNDKDMLSILDVVYQSFTDAILYHLSEEQPILKDVSLDILGTSDIFTITSFPLGVSPADAVDNTFENKSLVKALDNLITLENLGVYDNRISITSDSLSVLSRGGIVYKFTATNNETGDYELLITEFKTEQALKEYYNRQGIFISPLYTITGYHEFCVVGLDSEEVKNVYGVQKQKSQGEIQQRATPSYSKFPW